MNYLLALDPGGTTGWSTWTYDAFTPIRHIEHGMIRGGLRGFLDWWVDAERRSIPDEVVIEDFILDGRTPKPDTTALEVIGAVAAFCFVLDIPLIRQRNVYKIHVTDDKLRDLGLWWKGAGHDRDSARHAIAYLKVGKHVPTLKWAFPPRDKAAA